MKIRKAKSNDCVDIFSLRNSKEIRDISLNQEEMVLSNHIVWFTRNIDMINIIEIDGKYAGHYFIKNDFISIYIKKEHRNKGIGSDILRKLKGYAIILDDNKRSIGAFAKAGYKQVGIVMNK